MAITSSAAARPDQTTAGSRRRRPGWRRWGTGTRARALGALTAIGTTAALTAGLTIGSAGPAHAGPGDVIVVKSDPRGDVTVLPRKGPGKVARASIDLRSVGLVEESGGVRMTISLQRVLTNSKYTQVVEVQMKPADATQLWFLDVSMNGQQPTTASASYSPDLDGANTQLCQPLVATVDPEADTLSVIVPDRCLPTDPAKIRVFSSLAKTSGGAFSLDKLTVRGSYVMHG